MLGCARRPRAGASPLEPRMLLWSGGRFGRRGAGLRGTDVPFARVVAPMIESFKQLEELGRDRDLAEVFLESDSADHAVPAADILETLSRRRGVMRDCIERGKGGGLSMGKLVGNEARLLNDAFLAGKTFLDPLTVKAEIYALSVMGENSRMGVIVAAPTAGAGGVVPGMLLALEEERNVAPEKTVRALVVAGGIGSIIALSAHISGAAGGCQNEVGVAASMGAAAAAYMMGGNTKDCIHAAALALKNTLGLVCDPVGGLVEVPCVKRNAIFAVHGLTAAQLALAGVTSVIPMDEIVEAMVRIGRSLPRGLKETAEGGLATTITGCEIGQRIKDEANERRAQRAAERERTAQERKTSVAQ
jgi:L-serine dehydratase